MQKKTLVAVMLVCLVVVMMPVVARTQAPLEVRVAELGRAQVGVPFVFGGETTRGFDASGLLSFVFGRFDIAVPRTIAGQFAVGQGIARNALRPGDIVLFAHGESRWTGLFVGRDEVVWASRSARRVRLASLNDPSISAWVVGARRILVVPEVDNAVAVIATAEKFLGIPYLFGAEGPERFDCSGFTQWVYAAHDIELPRTSRSQALVGRSVPRDSVKRGDLLIFVDTWRPGISHVGIYIEDGRFIHATPRAGVSYANLDQDYWGTRLHSVRRVLP